MKSSDRWGHWGGDAYQSGEILTIKRHICQRIGLEAEENISMLRSWVLGLNFSTTTLNYPSLKGITIDRVDTNSLRYVGADALSLTGYSDRDIKKWGDGEGKLLRNTLESNYIVLQRACQLQWSETSNLSTSLTGNTSSWLVSL